MRIEWRRFEIFRIYFGGRLLNFSFQKYNSRRNKKIRRIKICLILTYSLDCFQLLEIENNKPDLNFVLKIGKRFHLNFIFLTPNKSIEYLHVRLQTILINHESLLIYYPEKELQITQGFLALIIRKNSVHIQNFHVSL